MSAEIVDAPRRHHLPEHLHLRLDFAAWVPQQLEREETLFRVCQEAVSNAIRHSQAKRLRIEAVVSNTEAIVRISDDGRGIGDEFRPGIGLSSMRQRVEVHTGQLRISANAPRGTLIEARMPRLDRKPGE